MTQCIPLWHASYVNMAKLIEDRTGWRENQIKFNKEKSKNNLEYEDSVIAGGEHWKTNSCDKNGTSFALE